MSSRRLFIQTTLAALAALACTADTQAKSCLWKVSSTTGILYLQGSVHVLKAQHYPLAPAIEQAYTESAALILEVDMGEMTSLETQRKIMAKAMLPGTDTLKTTLDVPTYHALESKCSKMGLPIASLEKFKPWFASVTLALIKMQQMGFDPQYGLDKYFYDKASRDSKPVTGLETTEFQINLFDSLAESDPNQFVNRALADLSLFDEDLDHLEKAWINGQIDELGKLMTKSFADYPELYNTFILERNKRWSIKLSSILDKTDSKTHMVVVGAGHLPGKGGLLDLLTEKGFTLEQL